MRILDAAKELLGIVLLRYRLVPRIWSVLLILVNACSVFFLDTPYGWVAFTAVVLGASTMIAIYAKLGFVRLIGIGHAFWVPMLIWIAVDFSMLAPGTRLRQWLFSLLVVNTICLVVDCIDVIRYARGEKAPYYTWD